MSEALDLAAEEQKDDAFLSGRVGVDSDDSQNDSRRSMRILERWMTRRAIYKEDYARTVEVANQSVWYLGVFYITHIWSTSNRIVQQVNNGKTRFGLILCHSWFDPFQGFLNFVVYQRPRYLKIRKSHPTLGVLGAVRRALRFSYLPNLEKNRRPRRLSTTGTEKDSKNESRHMQHAQYETSKAENEHADGSEKGAVKVVLDIAPAVEVASEVCDDSNVESTNLETKGDENGF